MKKVLKTMTKCLAVFLSILFIVEILPTQVMAEAYSDYSAEKQYISDLIENPAESDDKEKAEILYEVTEKRDENTKVYKRADGTYTALVSQTPLHFMSDGAWKEINNTLVSKNGVLTNADNPFNVTLPERITSDSQITLENDGSEISFAVNDISSSDSKITEKRTDITEAFEAAVAKTKSEVKYEDVAEDTDIEYVVLTNGIKENIIVSDASSVKNTYSFDFDIGDLSYRLNVNNSVEIIDADNNVKFTIPAPVMIDSKLAFSYDIGVSITDNNNGTITLVYSPSKEWTGASERCYPITIDPAIVCNDYETWVEDAFVYNDTTDATSANSTGYNEGLALVADHSETVNGITEIYSGEVYTKINTDLFSSFGNGVVFTNVQYVFSGAVRDGSVGIKEITSSCNLETVTYNTKPTLDNSVVDFYTGTSSVGNQVSNLEVVNFDITSLFNSWINGETNNGFAVTALDNSATAILMLNGELNFFGSHTYTTTLIADYVYAAGYDESYNYHSQELGKAGTAYINDFTRELFLKRDDIAISGNIMPVSVSFMYNSGIDEYFSYCKSVDENYVVPQEVYGNNWTSNYNRLIYLNMMSVDAGLLYANYLTENGNIISFAVEMQLDEDDNEVIVFVEEGNSSGYSMELLETPSNYSGSYCDYIQVTRPDGTAERFDENGRLISVTKTVVTDDTPSYQTITVNYVSDLSNDNNFLAIDYITDGVGRKYQFVYDSVSGLLASIQCYDSDNAVIKAANNTTAMSNTYTYSAQSNLTSVSFNGVNKFTYDYDTQSNSLTQVELGNQYKVVYTYNSGSNTIAQMKEYAKPSANEAYAEGSTINIVQQSPYQVQFSNGDNYSIVEQFNADGTLFDAIDNRGNYSSGAKVSTNLLENNSFENGLSSWTASGITSNDITTDTADSSTHSLDIVSSVSSNKEISQIVTVPDGDVYTFSAYIKSDEVDVDNKLTMKIEAIDNQNNAFNSNTRTIAATATEYTRYSVQLPYILDEFIAVKVTIGLDNTIGNFNIDTLQLEVGNGTGNYDYLANGSLALNNGGNIDSWSNIGAFTSGTDTVLGSIANYIKLDNETSANASKSISQTVAFNGEKDDIVTFGCWVKGNVANNGDNITIIRMAEAEELPLNDKSDRIAGIKLEYTYTDEENEQQTETIIKSVNGCVQDWQFLSEYIILKGDCSGITVYLLLENTTGDISFAKAFLSKNSVSAPNPEETELSIEGDYHEPNVFYSGEGEGEGNEGTSNIEETYCVCGEDCAYGAGCPCTCTSEEDCNCPECQKKFDIQYDRFGNLLSMIIRGITISTLFSMFNSKTYTNDGNYAVTSTNENNKTTTYLYNRANGFLQSETDPNNNTTSYTYDSTGNIQSVSARATKATVDWFIFHDIVLTNTIETKYTYDVLDRVTGIQHKDFKYILSYDGFGNVRGIKTSYPPYAFVVTRDFITYQYGTGEHSKRLESIVYYTNGQSSYSYDSYSYDSQGNLIEIINHGAYSSIGSTSHRYYYDSLGNIVAELDLVNNTPSRVVYTNENSVEVYSDGDLHYYASYDEDGNFYEIIDGKKYTTVQGEGVTDETTGEVAYKTTVSDSSNTLAMTKLDDAFGRTIQKGSYSVDPSSGNTTGDFSAIITDYTYKTDEQDPTITLGLIDTFSSSLYYGTSICENNKLSDYSYRYEYDNNGNITHEYNQSTNELRYRYQYDEVNQLVRFDDNVNHKTYTYMYDAGCNIEKRTTYAFTLNDLGTALQEDDFVYGGGVSTDGNRDLLIKYNNGDITYDDVGNPTHYGNKYLYWIGKQLRKIEYQNEKIEYEYDANGLRTQKRHYKNYQLDYTVDYIWSDGKIVVQSLNYPLTLTINGQDVTQWIKINSKFVYPNGESTPCAIIINGQEFLLVRDLQGDVTALILADSGETIADFSYDPWGNITYDIHDEQYNTHLELCSNYNQLNQQLQEYRKLLQAVVTALCPVTYRGYNYDFSTGLYYLQARYYNPVWGRFINADDTAILLSTTGTLHGANLYAYCDNNPVNKVDYSGKKPIVLKLTLTGLIEYLLSLYLSIKLIDKFGYQALLRKELFAHNYYIKEGSLFLLKTVLYDHQSNYYIMEFLVGEKYAWDDVISHKREIINNFYEKMGEQIYNDAAGIDNEYKYLSYLYTSKYQTQYNLAGDYFNLGIGTVALKALTINDEIEKKYSIYEKTNYSVLAMMAPIEIVDSEKKAIKAVLSSSYPKHISKEMIF